MQYRIQENATQTYDDSQTVYDAKISAYVRSAMMRIAAGEEIEDALEKTRQQYSETLDAGQLAHGEIRTRRAARYPRIVAEYALLLNR